MHSVNEACRRFIPGKLSACRDVPKPLIKRQKKDFTIIFEQASLRDVSSFCRGSQAMDEPELICDGDPAAPTAIVVIIRYPPRSSAWSRASAAAEHILLAPDRGMKYLTREADFGGLSAMVRTARDSGREYGGH